MKVFFIGGVYPPQEEDKIRANSKFGLDNASNNLQWALIEGLSHYYEDLTVVSVSPVRTFPRGYNKVYLQSSSFQCKPDILGYSIGFVNIVLIKHVSIYFNLKRALSALMKENDDVIIINYGIHSPKLKVIYELKRKNTSIKTCLIVPDLPQYMSESQNIVYRLFKLVDYNFISHYIKKIDSFALLSKYMKNRLPIENKPSIVVEGVYKSQKCHNITQIESYNTILYSGGLSKRYGIVELLRAFNGIESIDYKLWLCGSGDAENEIELFAKNDKRITYWGQLPHSEVLKLQKRAKVLVNPRNSEGIFTQYSFPSKTIEYLASGRPTIMNRLSGIPDEYFDYCFVPESEDEKGLRECIINVCEIPSQELATFGARAKDFIINNKNPEAQAQKIYNLVNAL